MLPELDTLTAIGQPFDILELKPGQSMDLVIDRMVLGKAVINPRDGRAAKTIYVLRVWAKQGSKPHIPDYWDITSIHLATAIWTDFNIRGAKGQTYHITKNGDGPQARFSLQIIPAGQAPA